MCRRKNNFTSNYKAPQQVKPPVADVQTLKQGLRIKLWQMIARNNGETLTDPLVKPLKNSMPYVKSDTTMNEDISEIKPTLDEVLPLPEKDTKEPKPSEEAPKKSKKKAADLLKPAAEPEEDKNQITVSEAIEEAKAEEAHAPNPTQADKQEPHAQSVSEEKPVKPTDNQKNNDVHADERKLTCAEVLREHLKLKREQRDRRDYFDALKLQIHNKNAACYELLDYLNELDEL